MPDAVTTRDPEPNFYPHQTMIIVPPPTTSRVTERRKSYEGERKKLWSLPSMPSQFCLVCRQTVEVVREAPEKPARENLGLARHLTAADFP